MSKDTTKGRDEEILRTPCVAIYLCGPEPDGTDQAQGVPPIDEQRTHCRTAAEIMRAEVIGEFVDESRSASFRPGLMEVMTLTTSGKHVSYLIVYSKKCLANTCDEMFEVAWRLGMDGIAVIATDEHYEAPWIEG